MSSRISYPAGKGLLDSALTVSDSDTFWGRTALWEHRSHQRRPSVWRQSILVGLFCPFNILNFYPSSFLPNSLLETGRPLYIKFLPVPPTTSFFITVKWLISILRKSVSGFLGFDFALERYFLAFRFYTQASLWTTRGSLISAIFPNLLKGENNWCTTSSLYNIALTKDSKIYFDFISAITCAIQNSKLMYQSNRSFYIPPRAFEFFENFCSNSPLPRPKSCSNAPS